MWFGQGSNPFGNSPHSFSPHSTLPEVPKTNPAYLGTIPGHSPTYPYVHPQHHAMPTAPAPAMPSAPPPDWPSNGQPVSDGLGPAPGGRPHATPPDLHRPSAPPLNGHNQQVQWYHHPGAGHQQTEQQVGHLRTQLEEATKLVGISSKLWTLIRCPTGLPDVDNLVRETAAQAQDYCNHLLPKSQELVSQVKVALRIYQTQQFWDFQINHRDIVGRAEGYRANAQIVADQHVKVASVVMHLQEMARRLEDPVQKYLKKLKRRQRLYFWKARVNQGMGWGILIVLPCLAVPVDLAGAGGAASAGASIGGAFGKAWFRRRKRASLEKADLSKKDVEKVRRALEVLQVDLHHCLDQFKKAMINCATFFAWLHSELAGYQDPSTSEMHFQIMKSQTQVLIRACDEFDAAATRVKADVLAASTNDFYKSARQLQQRGLLTGPGG